MEISNEVKSNAIEQRLKQYERKYMELKLDYIALKAAGDNSGAEIIANRMTVVDDSYNAVLLLKEGGAVKNEQ